MKYLPPQLTLLAGKIQPRHIRLILILLTLTLLVLGAGAPADGGGSIPGSGI